MEAVIAVKPMIEVAALCDSLRKASFNRGLIHSAIKISKEAINGYVDRDSRDAKALQEKAARKAAQAASGGGNDNGGRKAVKK